MNPFHILILAAGASIRMGRPKQLLPYKQTTLLGHAIEIARSVQPISLRVVLGAHKDAIQEGVSMDKVEKVYNEDWESGMAGSIKCGISSILKEKDSDQGTLIMLGDQPFVNGELLLSLFRLAKEKQKGIAASAYGDKLGVPAYFSSAYYPNLLELTGQAGAGKLIKAFQQDVVSIMAEDLTDVDTPEDYDKLISGNLSTRSE